MTSFICVGLAFSFCISQLHTLTLFPSSVFHPLVICHWNYVLIDRALNNTKHLFISSVYPNYFFLFSHYSNNFEIHPYLLFLSFLFSYFLQANFDFPVFPLLFSLGYFSPVILSPHTRSSLDHCFLVFVSPICAFVSVPVFQNIHPIHWISPPISLHIFSSFSLHNWISFINMSNILRFNFILVCSSKIFQHCPLGTRVCALTERSTFQLVHISLS